MRMIRVRRLLTRDLHSTNAKYMTRRSRMLGREACMPSPQIMCSRGFQVESNHQYLGVVPALFSDILPGLVDGFERLRC